MFKIGNIEIKNQVVLAPMAGISNTSYRKIIKSMGAGLIYCEMVSDKAITYGSNKTYDLLKMSEEERPIAQQIFGSDVETFVKAAKYIESTMHPDIIDINMGCPVPKVALRAQAGASLLKDPDKIYEIVSNVVAAVNTPVTVKIRSGWDASTINAVTVAKKIESAGASAITIHARTRAQGYNGNADWNIIREVKQNVSIPVIGNGDIKSCYDAKRMLEETGCDAVMIGRAAIGNPWIIKECVDYLENNITPRKITAEEKINMLKHHYEILIEDKGEKLASLEIRTHALSYIKGLEGNAYIKNEICKTTDKESMYKILDDYLTYLKNK
jgi:nifR3 family TIM-barrel protein